MPRPKKTPAAGPVPAPEPVPGRYVSPTNKATRLRDLKRTYRMPTNKIRHPKVNVDALVKPNELLAQGWNKREITQIKRYAVLSNEFNNIKRAYEDTLGDLKEKNSKVIEKLNDLSGNSVLLNESLLINVISKKAPNQGIKADALASKLQEKFGDLLSQYNIDLQAIIQELEEEAKANAKMYTSLTIGRQDYSQHFQSFRRSNNRHALKEFGLSDVTGFLKKAFDSFIGFFGKIAPFLKSLLQEKQSLEQIMIQMYSLQESKGNVSKYPRLYEKNIVARKKVRKFI